ncbi:hypothetical protein DFH29DRAFT_395056 [Suillus ampliporus]|nr:hypothetical protein DFH29DRAFT_395056 [Suillus ampliporus]
MSIERTYSRIKLDLQVHFPFPSLSSTLHLCHIEALSYAATCPFYWPTFGLRGHFQCYFMAHTIDGISLECHAGVLFMLHHLLVQIIVILRLVPWTATHLKPIHLQNGSTRFSGYKSQPSSLPSTISELSESWSNRSYITSYNQCVSSSSLSWLL